MKRVNHPENRSFIFFHNRVERFEPQSSGMAYVTSQAIHI
jgi:hypothetical protein